MKGLRYAFVVAVVTSFPWAACALAQCPPQWLPSGGGLAGVNAEVWTVAAWDPDGGGPEPEWLVAGGYFNRAGDVEAKRVAAWDGQQWRRLANGLALASYGGELVAAGVILQRGRIAGRQHRGLERAIVACAGRRHERRGGGTVRL